MSTFVAYFCGNCGAKSFDIEPCYVCDGQIDQPVACGIDNAQGFPNVVKDHMTPHFDFAAGQVISSRTERNDVYAAKGLVPKSREEHVRQHGSKVATHKRATSFPGQKLRRSTAEQQQRQRYV